MGLTRFVLKRPVATVMALLCLLVFGISSVFNATLEQMPDTDQPMLIIMASYSGAGPEDIDELVTQPIEDQVGTIEGVKSMSSTSSENRAMIMLEYDYGTDMDDAYNDLSQSLDALSRQLPDDAETSVMEMNNNAGTTMMLSISNPSQEDLYDYVDQTVVPLLEQISSVAEVEAMGGKSEYYKIELQSDEMAQYQVTMSDVSTAMSTANLSYPSGDAVSGKLELSVSTSLEHNVGSGQGSLGIPQQALVLLCLYGPETALQHHNGVIHHHAYSQHQTAHGNDIQGETSAGHQNQRHQYGGGYGASYNQGRLIISKENEYDNHGNHGCQHQGKGHVLKGTENAVRAVPDNPDIQVLIIRLQALNNLLNLG